MSREAEDRQRQAERQAQELGSVQEELRRMREEGESKEEVEALRESLRRLERLASIPGSVYFNAVREGPYSAGGEEYLVRAEGGEILLDVGNLFSVLE